MRTLTMLLLAFALAACGASNHHAASSPSQSAAVKVPGDARVGDRTRCPVSGEEFVVTESSPKAEYNGKTYYFCCGGCDAKFKENPQKFLNSGST